MNNGASTILKAPLVTAFALRYVVDCQLPSAEGYFVMVMMHEISHGLGLGMRALATSHLSATIARRRAEKWFAKYEKIPAELKTALEAA